jgi:DNA-binding GntR family transcriptional regulator
MVEALQASLVSLPARQRMSDRVADDLFRLIVTLQLKPGSILNENALMQHLQCGRTPLREALMALERRSLIKIVPRQATMVTEITLADAAEVFEALRCLEGPVARLAAERIDDADLDELRGHLEALEAMDTIRAGLYARAEADFGFHEVVARAAANQFLWAALDALRGPTMRLMCLSFRQADVLSCLVAEHRRVFAALSAHDADAAERAMRDHADADRRRMFDQAASYPFR